MSSDSRIERRRCCLSLPTTKPPLAFSWFNKSGWSAYSVVFCWYYSFLLCYLSYLSRSFASFFLAKVADGLLPRSLAGPDPTAAILAAVVLKSREICSLTLKSSLSIYRNLLNWDALLFDEARLTSLCPFLPSILGSESFSAALRDYLLFWSSSIKCFLFILFAAVVIFFCYLLLTYRY